MKSIVILAAIVSFPLLTACSASNGSSDLGASSAAETTAAHKGQKCGGSALDARECATGLTCVGVNPQLLGSTGKCEASAAQQGETCGGSALDALECATGLTCVGVNPQLLGSTGTCQPDGANQCNAAADCSGLLPQICEQCADGTGQCAHFDCNQSQCVITTCQDDGGPATVDAGTTNQCQAPTDCSGALPQLCEQCADGTSQCAHFDCNQSQCQVTVCEDNGGSATVDAGTTNQCQAPTDCSGALPQLCEQCADGTSQCAHFDCNQNQCQVTVCEDDGGAATP